MEKKTTFFQELKARWSADSPVFFDKIKSFGLYLSGLAVSLSGIPALLNETGQTDIDLSLLIKISSYIAVAGVVITGVAKLPVSSSVRDSDIKKV